MISRAGCLTGGLPYLAAGTGPPVVLLPGIGADNADVGGGQRRTTLRSVRPLTRHCTVYVVNRRPGLAPDSTLDDLADDYADALAPVFGEPVDVVGISTGGSIAQLLAARHPALVRRLVLFASACRLSPYGRRVQRDLARYASAGDWRRAWAATGPALAGTRPGAVLATALMWLAGRRSGAADPSDLLITVAAEDAFDAEPVLGRISAPTLVIGGGRDRFYSPALFELTARGIPRSRLVLYPRRGHVGTVAHRGAVAAVGRFLRDDAG